MNVFPAPMGAPGRAWPQGAQGGAGWLGNLGVAGWQGNGAAQPFGVGARRRAVVPQQLVEMTRGEALHPLVAQSLAAQGFDPDALLAAAQMGEAAAELDKQRRDLAGTAYSVSATLAAGVAQTLEFRVNSLAYSRNVIFSGPADLLVTGITYNGTSMLNNNGQLFAAHFPPTQQEQNMILRGWRLQPNAVIGITLSSAAGGLSAATVLVSAAPVAC